MLEGFKIGADDYITKPFSMEELIFRIDGNFAQNQPGGQGTDQAVYKLGRYTFDPRKQILINEGKTNLSN